MHFRFKSIPIGTFVCLCLCFASVVHAQRRRAQEAFKTNTEPSIHAEISADELFIGESIDLQVEIRNAEKPTTPDLTALRDQFDVESTGETRTQSSTVIINGRVKSNVSGHVYTFKLKPKISGKLTIPPVTTTIDGKSLATSSIPISVLDAEEQDTVLVKIVSSPSEVFPTQLFTVSVQVFLKPISGREVDPLQPLRQRPPQLQVDLDNTRDGLKSDDKSEWLGSLLSNNGIGFALNEFNTRSGSLFDSPKRAVFDLRKGRETQRDLRGNDVEYFAFELQRKFKAEKTGTYSFGPAFVKGTFVTGQNGSDYVGKKIVAIAPSIDVLVKDVPSPRPVDYTGGIGTYSIRANASPLKLRVGDPLTITLDIERGKDSGSLELLSAPDLGAVNDLTQAFDIIDSKPTGRIEGNTKKFAYAIRPKRPGVGVPAISLSTFDPITQNFVHTKTEPIELDVAEATQMSNAELVGASTKSNSNEIKMNSQGIFQNISDPALLRDERLGFVQCIRVVAGFWFAMGMAIVGVALYRRNSSDTVRQRRQRASRSAHSKLNAAKVRSANSADALRAIRSSIVDLVADTGNRLSDGMTSADVMHALEFAKVPTDDVNSVRKLLDLIEAAEYGAGDKIDSTSLIKDASKLIDRIAPFLERSYR